MKLQNSSKLLIILYFVNLVLYSFSSLLEVQPFEAVFWFVRIPILMVLYYITSKKKQAVYLVGLMLYQCASVFFATGDASLFIFGTLSSVLFKLCLSLLVLDLVTSNNRLAVTISVVPFFVLYLYIINFVIDELGDSYYIWILNALLTSFLGGVAIINYINTPGKKEYWLLVSAIFFVIQIGAFFINKFYVKNEAVYQLVILLYGVSHFTFYQFLILKENEGNDKKNIPTL
ncbi:hypothetical protein NAT51_13880 [Flavobacterium amniphilum]|uniref:hypothetical protein n=1 Tax=Flavobacterium amniphilum TaxID=1834035 RepID=UPI00202A0DD2|nr:hypothetical protein [Flavobacterium amniphilum]MCL9806620.1 hypothetical protein [Flavobacterium amniphilum]